MATWARTLSGDMYFPPPGSGADAIVRDVVEETRIKIQSVLQFVLGEWIYDTSLGVNWAKYQGVKSPDLFAMRLDIEKQILAIANVASITFVNLDFDEVTRNITFGWEVKLVGGQTVGSS